MIFKAIYLTSRFHFAMQHVGHFTVICNQLLAITGFLSATYFSKIFTSFLHHSKVLDFLSWLRSLSIVFVQFSIGQFFFPVKICLCLSATHQTVCKTLLTSHSGWTLDSDHVRRSRHLMTSVVRLYSNYKLCYTNQNVSFTLFII